jgi:hypothetical protein
MATDEIPLRGGTHGPVVRVGNTVRREARPSTPAVQALLRHLECAGFDGAPRTLGLDDRGREVLSFIPGDVPIRRGSAVLPGYVRDEETLAGVARLLRRFHEATTGFIPPPDAAWAFQTGAPRSGDVICHNDIGPWNTVFVEGRPVAFIDFDTAAPGPRIWDVAYACYRFVPYVPDEICALIGWPAPPDRPRRLRLFCEAYGLADWSTVLDVIVRRIEVMVATGMAAHTAGDPNHGEEWLRVMRSRLLRDIAFIAQQRAGS